MKWVVLAILLFVVGYTVVMIRYRKPGQAYRPHADGLNRATVSRLLAVGYQRGQFVAERPVDPSAGSVLGGAPKAKIDYWPGGLGSELKFALAETPMMAESVGAVTASAEAEAIFPYKILCTISIADHKRVITGGQWFRKEDQLLLLPTFERVQGELMTRTKESPTVLTIPAGAFPPGRHDVILIGEKGSKRWSVTFR
jgi:hypothetical protein